jgi:biopolymer transport protein ExbD
MENYDFFEEKTDPEILLTPLIDVILVLLIIFIISSPVIYYNVKVSLPSSMPNSSMNFKNDICFAIDQYNNIYDQNMNKIKLNEVSKIISPYLIKFPSISCIIFSDKDSQAGILIELIDKIKNTGISNVYCKTKKINIK